MPSSVLDLSNWKITLPVDKNGNASTSCDPLEVTQPALASFSDQWFQVVGNAVQFRANIEGCTTSNSSYPRSELREMTGGGKTEASWSTTTGTATMTVTESVDHLPAVKQQVVFAQVHGSSDDIAFGEATGQSNGTDLLDFNHNGTSWGTLDPAYVPGTRFTLKIVAAAGFIDVYYNGVDKVHHAASATGCYFKAGDYTQSNVAKGHDAPGAYGQVSISALSVTHS